MAMFKTPRGAKLKVKSKTELFGLVIFETKEGFYFKSVAYASLAKAEAAVADYVAAVNTRQSTWESNAENCLSRYLAHEMRVGHLRRDPGIAVGVKLDSMGKAISYLSFAEWEEMGFKWPKAYKAFW